MKSWELAAKLTSELKIDRPFSQPGTGISLGDSAHPNP
jgi:hypothetical protein